MITISFPGGAGGNWLRAVIEDDDLSNQQVNFHKHSPEKKFVKIIHEIDTEKFDYLLSGNYYYNFFVNVVYKFFHHGLNFTKTRSYKDYYTECVNTARYICQFDNIRHCIFFNFDDLIHDDTKFYQKVISVRPTLNLSYSNFVDKKKLFFSTMVDTRESYENFDNQIWVTFVLGQLMNQNIIPNNFSIYDPDNQSLASKFAKENYDHCKLTQVYHFESNIILPNILQTN